MTPNWLSGSQRGNLLTCPEDWAVVAVERIGATSNPVRFFSEWQARDLAHNPESAAPPLAKQPVDTRATAQVMRSAPARVTEADADLGGPVTPNAGPEMGPSRRRAKPTVALISRASPEQSG